MTRPRLVVFDMAGTTVRTAGDVPAALREAFAEAGVTLTDEMIRAVRGRAKREVIRELLFREGDPRNASDAAAESIHRSFDRRLRDTLLSSACAVPGAEAAFRWLREHDVRSALTTGFGRETTTFLLRRLGWSDPPVDAVVCADDVRAGRPAPDMILRAMEQTGVMDPAAVVVVGDTVSDMESAARAGVAARVGVLSGAHDRAALEADAGAVVLASVAELPTWLQERFGLGGGTPTRAGAGPGPVGSGRSP